MYMYIIFKKILHLILHIKEYCYAKYKKKPCIKEKKHRSRIYGMHVLRYKWMYHNTNLALKTIRSITGCITTIYFRILIIGSTCILNLLAGKYSEDTRKKGKFKARKQGHLTIGGSFICRSVIG